MDIKALIAKQRAELDVKKVVPVQVVLGGEKVTVEVGKLTPDVWDDLVSTCPPRPGVEGDAMVGYNPKRLASLYPDISINGEPLSADDWADMYSVLDSAWRNNIEVTIWGVNVNESLQELRRLGKARSGKDSTSPES